MEDTIREWTLPAGSRVKINGLPFALRDEAVVRGAHSPDDFPVGEMSPNDCDHRGGAGVPTITRDTAPASGASLGSHVGGSMLTDDDKTEIDARITERISMFRETLIEQGQIQDVSLRGPSAIRPPSDCIQSARTHWGGQQEDPIPR